MPRDAVEMFKGMQEAAEKLDHKVLASAYVGLLTLVRAEAPHVFYEYVGILTSITPKPSKKGK